MFNKFIVGSLLALSFSFVSCNLYGNSAEVKEKEVVSSVQLDEEALKIRVQSRWDALIERDFVSAYEYFSPSYRKLFPVGKYASGFGSAITWESIAINDVVVDGSRAQVKVEVFYELNNLFQQGGSADIGLISTQKEETWLRIDEDWWYIVLDDSKGV